MSTGQCSVLAERHTDLITHVVKEDGRKKTAKRNSDNSLEGSSKRRGTSSSEGCSQTSGSCTANITSLSTGSEDRKSSKGKSEETEEPRKRSKNSKSEETEEPRKRSTKKKSKKTEEPRKRSTKKKSEETEEPRKRSTKRKSEETEEPRKRSTKKKSKKTEEPRKRSRNTSRSPVVPSEHATEVSTSDKPGTSSATTVNNNSRDAFTAKYKQFRKLLGQGGFGSVFAGLRRDDNLPVAIKHIPKRNIKRTSMILDGKIRKVPMEVALLLKLKPAEDETSAVAALLDWYDLDSELILILERPVPCMNLRDYSVVRKHIPEDEVKIIVKELVDALIEIHSKGVFHRDIKPQNILIQTGSDVPRVKIIDFGCGTYLHRGPYFRSEGTYQFIPPEWYRFKCYRAEPLTVWQLGLVLFRILHGYLPFYHSREIVHGEPALIKSLSSNCQDFLSRCLFKGALLRPTLKALRKHPWLM